MKREVKEIRKRKIKKSNIKIFFWFFLFVWYYLGLNLLLTGNINWTADTLANLEINTNQVEQLECNMLTNIILPELATQSNRPISTKERIQKYCEIISNPKNNFQCIWWEKQVYKAKDSLFSYLLCNTVNPNNDQQNNFFNPNFQEKKYLKTKNINELGIIPFSFYQNNCNPEKTTMNDCKIEYYFPKIEQTIMNDFYNMGQIQIFWVSKNKENIDKKANNFSKKNFAGLEICNKENIKIYGKTCKILKEFISNIEKLLERTTILDNKVISKQGKENDCKDMKDITKYDSVFCGIMGNQPDQNFHFNNMIYNELFRYRIFSNYYLHSLKNPDMTAKLLPVGNENNYEKERSITLITKNRNIANKKIIKAIPLANEKIQEIQNTLPYHIGFLMYQEDLINIRRPLANMYTPIRTLFDKLRNVQDANS